MRSRPPVALAFLAAAVLLTCALPRAAGQGPGDVLAVSVDYELFGVSQLAGGGHVTWALAGEPAREIRAKIVGLYDEYVQIPRGFLFSGAPTSGNADGQIDAGEGLAFTGHLENELEGVARNFTGTRIGYFLLDRADLYEQGSAGALARSTTGLLGTRANATEDLSIRFVFSGSTVASDSPLALPTRAYADALYEVFSFRDRQSPSLSATYPYPAAWPFAEGAWRIALADDGRPALWAGNGSTGQYDNSMLARMTAYDDALLGPALDLRFASAAWASFSYTGQVAGPGDSLAFEVSTAPNFTAWSRLEYAGQPTLPPTPVGVWSNVSFDLSAYAGQKIRLRFTFQSDALGQGRGFFVRDFAIDAPSSYEGIVAASEAHYLVGPISFTEVSVSTGSVALLRTPGGEVLFYSATRDLAALTPDTIRFRSFEPLENPQALFAVMTASAYMISRSQEVAFDRYRAAQAMAFRQAAPKARWLHAAGKAAIVALILLYFVPTALYVLRVPFFVSGPVYLGLAVGLAAGLALGTRACYERRQREGPPPASGETRGASRSSLAPRDADECAHCRRGVPALERGYICDCGLLYHLHCAQGRTHCEGCQRPITVEIVRKQRLLTARCVTCGEEQTFPLGEDPRTLPCRSCGAPLRHLEAGRWYLVLASNPAILFDWLRDPTQEGKPAVCLTTAAPERLRLEFGLGGMEVFRVSASAPRAIDPRRLDPLGLKALQPLLRSEKGGALLCDALDEMIAEASMGDILRFLRRAREALAAQRVTVIVRVNPGGLAPAEIERLAGEFDETLDFAARPIDSLPRTGPSWPEAMLHS